MRFQKPPAELVPQGLRAMKMIATEARELSVASKNILLGVQRVFLETDIPLAELPPISGEELAASIADPVLRTQLVQGMLMLSLADGPPSSAQMDRVDGFAQALGVAGPELRSLRLLADEHTVFFRLHFLRHSHLGEVARRGLREEGIFAPIKALLSLRGLYENAELAARYRALEKLPEDTLGFGFTKYIHENKFGYPGEKFGFPEGGIWHDFGHVLAGYGTDPEGEIQMAAFQAGYRKNNAFFMLLFGALTFSAGVNVTPLPQPDTRGLMAREGLFERVFLALQRGSKMKVDLFEGWDPFDHVELPLEEARLKFGVEPA